MEIHLALLSQIQIRIAVSWFWLLAEIVVEYLTFTGFPKIVMADKNYFPWRYRCKLQHPIHTCINRRHHFQTSLFPKWEWNRNRVSFCRFWAEAQANKQTSAAKNASLMLWIKLRVQFVLKHEWMATAGILPWMGCCGGGKKTVGKCSLEQCRKYVLDNTSCWKRVRSKKGVGKRCIYTTFSFF